MGTLPTGRARRRSGRRASIRSGRAAQRAVQRLRQPPPGDRAWSPLRSTSGTCPAAERRPDACNAAPRADRPRRSSRSPGSRRCPSPRQQARHGLDHQAGGHLSPVEHDVADAQLAVDEVLADPVIDPLVAPAQQAEPVAAGQLAAPAPGRTAGRPARAGTAVAAGRPPRPMRRSARAASASRHHRRTAQSSTVRCTSVVCSRRIVAAAGRRGRVARALPSRLSAQNASTRAGKRVNTSIRTASPVEVEQAFWRIDRDHAVVEPTRRTSPAPAHRSRARADRRPDCRRPRRSGRASVPPTSTTSAPIRWWTQSASGRRSVRRTGGVFGERLGRGAIGDPLEVHPPAVVRRWRRR